MVETPRPRRTVKVEVEWIDGLEADPVEDLEATDGGWHLSVTIQGRFLPITDHDWPEGGYKTIGEAVTAVEKWANDRNMNIRDTSIEITCWPNVKETR